jgi:hypothetical protein
MSPLDDFIIITEVDHGPAFAGHIFRRKFGEELTAMPHHVVAFFRAAEDTFVPVTYLHLWLRDGVGLVGGVCTDGRVFARMSPEQRDRVQAAGGVYRQVVLDTFRRFGERCEAYFGLVGDPRSWTVNLEAGFVPTQHPKLIVHWHRPLPPPRQAELIARVHAFGPF